jgi:hypothetical protein
MKKDWKILGFICFQIAIALRKHNVSYIYTGLPWWSDHDMPNGYIMVRPEDIDNIVKAN